MPLRIAYYQILRGAVDQYAVVHVSEEHIAGGRRGDIGRRHDIGGHGNKHRHRQHIGRSNDVGWRQHNELRRRRRQEIDRWRRRRETEGRIGEIKDGTVDIDDFLRRRRRKAHIDGREPLWRLHRDGAVLKPTPHVPGMGTMRIAPQVRPIGAGRVHGAHAPPEHRLPASREHGAHAFRRRIAGIGGEIFLITLQTVLRYRGRIAVGRPKLRDGL